MNRNEHTSKKLATIAAMILHARYEPTRRELLSIAGSLLTQSPGKTEIIAMVKAKHARRKHLKRTR